MAQRRTDRPPDPAAASSTAGPMVMWREAYAAFMTEVTRDPTLSSVVGLGESLTGCAVVVTDRHGAVIGSSAAYTGEAHIDPPPLDDVLNRAAWTDDRVVATPMAAPGRWFIWLTDGADPGDPLHRAVLRIAAELTHLLMTFPMSQVPSTRLERAHLAERMVRGDDRDRIRDDAERLGYAIDQPSRAVVVLPPSGVTATQFSTIMGAPVYRCGPVTVRDGRVIMVVFGDQDLARALDALAALSDVTPQAVGVGGAEPDGCDMRRSYAQAVRVAERTTASDDLIRRFDDQDPIDLLTDLADPDTVELLISRSLGPLLTYDPAHRQDLLFTLGRWLGWTGSLETLADELHIHKSTLIYRLKRIKELLDDDLTDGKRRFEIELALRLLGHRSTIGDDRLTGTE